jgi:hypothetical protein
MSELERRFPSPWTTQDNGTWFLVRDANGPAVAYIYYEEEAGLAAFDRHVATVKPCNTSDVVRLQLEEWPVGPVRKWRWKQLMEGLDYEKGCSRNVREGARGI